MLGAPGASVEQPQSGVQNAQLQRSLTEFASGLVRIAAVADIAQVIGVEVLAAGPFVAATDLGEVIAVLAIEAIGIAGARVQFVVATAAVNGVVVGIAVKRVVTAVAINPVLPIAAFNVIITPACVGFVRASSSFKATNVSVPLPIG